jgi:NAD(P)H dehydrogenase (quinone)
MESVKLAIIYYSATGANYKMSQWAAEGALAAGADVKVLKAAEIAPEAAIAANSAWQKHAEATRDISVVSLDDLEWADAIIFSVPTRYGSPSAQIKQFLDTTGGLWYNGKLANKVVSAMATAANPHGGQEATILSLYTTMHHWGAIVVAPGYTDPALFGAGGNPYGASATVDSDGNIKEDVRDAVVHQAKRTVQIASWIKKGILVESV